MVSFKPDGWPLEIPWYTFCVSWWPDTGAGKDEERPRAPLPRCSAARPRSSRTAPDKARPWSNLITTVRT